MSVLLEKASRTSVSMSAAHAWITEGCKARNRCMCMDRTDNLTMCKATCWPACSLSSVSAKA
eukprot:6050120-Amphidinium_carterae.6